MAFVPQPLGLAFDEWAAIIVEQFSNEGVPENAPDETRWQEWGEKIQEVDALSDIPHPANFSTWQEWAERVVESLDQV